MTHTRHFWLCALMIGALYALPSCRAKRHTMHHATHADSVQIERSTHTVSRSARHDTTTTASALSMSEWAVVERFDTLGRITERLTKGRTTHATEASRHTAHTTTEAQERDTTSYRHASTATERTATQQEAQALGGGFSLSWVLGGALIGFALCAFALYRFRLSRT